MIRNFKDTPIQRKLMNIILLSCGVVVFLMCTAYMIFEYFTFRDTLKSQVSTLAAVIASNSTSSLAFDYPDDANEVLSALKEEKHIVSACLYDINGKLFAKYPVNISNDQLPAGPGKSGFVFNSGYLNGFQS